MMLCTKPMPALDDMRRVMTESKKRTGGAPTSFEKSSVDGQMEKLRNQALQHPLDYYGGSESKMQHTESESGTKNSLDWLVFAIGFMCGMLTTLILVLNLPPRL